MAKQEFNEQYHEMEERYRSKVYPLHEQERRLREFLRMDVTMEPEDKQRAYMQGWNEINAKFEELANDFGRRFDNDRLALEEKIHKGTGKAFGEHLASLSSTPDEKLDELLTTAERTGQKDLARAVAATALTRSKFGVAECAVFHRWADSDPELADALKRHRTLPPENRFLDRTLAIRPPRADAESLQSTQVDWDLHYEEQRRKEADRNRFFNLPKYGSPENPIRQVGGRGAVDRRIT